MPGQGVPDTVQAPRVTFPYEELGTEATSGLSSKPAQFLAGPSLAFDWSLSAKLQHNEFTHEDILCALPVLIFASLHEQVTLKCSYCFVHLGLQAEQRVTASATCAS